MSDDTTSLAPEPIREDDLPQVFDLIGAVYREYGFEFNPDAPEEAHLTDACNAARRAGGEFWVVRHDGIVRATVSVRMDPEHPEAELKTMYVHPSLRRRGLGSRLLHLAIDHARRAGARRLTLWSDTRFVEAHRLYERHGFRRTGQRHVEGWDTFDEYGYALELDAA